jgi:hypothetical protein
MTVSQLSPKEKKRLERCIHNVEELFYKEGRTEVEDFIMRQQLRAIIRIFGGPKSDRVLEKQALKILGDIWPFKERRLRKLIDGR